VLLRAQLAQILYCGASSSSVCRLCGLKGRTKTDADGEVQAILERTRVPWPLRL
jgi:hypothetical protein